MVSKEQKNIINERNACIYERFCNLSEQQPLAYRQTIFSYLAQEYDLSPQMISVIIKSKENESNQDNN